MPELPSLPPLPPQPAGVSWPTNEWPSASIENPDQRRCLNALIADLFNASITDSLGLTKALIVAHRGSIVAERYGEGIEADTVLPSWSLSKSVLNALTGLMVRDGYVNLDDPLSNPRWPPGDPRRAITIRQALHMRTGLEWNEDYENNGVSNVVEMLYLSGKSDTAAYVADRPLEHDPGTTYFYSSGTSNLLSAYLGSVLAAKAITIDSYLREELFDPLGMRSPQPRFDEAGTWIGSTYCDADARDFARFALLFLRGGRWDDRQLLPGTWVDLTRTPQPDVDDEGWGYGLHWWTLPTSPGTFFASGYLSQYLFVVPQLDLLIVRLGETPSDPSHPVLAHLERIAEAFSEAEPTSDGAEVTTTT